MCIWHHSQWETYSFVNIPDFFEGKQSTLIPLTGIVLPQKFKYALLPSTETKKGDAKKREDKEEDDVTGSRQAFLCRCHVG